MKQGDAARQALYSTQLPEPPAALHRRGAATALAASRARQGSRVAAAAAHRKPSCGCACTSASSPTPHAASVGARSSRSLCAHPLRGRGCTRLLYMCWAHTCEGCVAGSGDNSTPRASSCARVRAARRRSAPAAEALASIHGSASVTPAATYAMTASLAAISSCTCFQKRVCALCASAVALYVLDVLWPLCTTQAKLQGLNAVRRRYMPHLQHWVELGPIRNALHVCGERRAMTRGRRTLAFTERM